ncbi:MAG: hypothetical protein ABGX05_10010 [Pirellulaceae bacterium]
MLRSRQKVIRFYGGLVCLAAPLITFVAILGFDFVMWDDDRAIINNPFTGGLSLERLPIIFSDLKSTSHFTPVTGLFRSLIYELFPPSQEGMLADGYHFGSWLLHATSTVLLYLVCYELFTVLRKKQGGRETQAIRRRQVVISVLGALLWSLHPLRVEPVSWVSSGNHCLATTFLFLAVFFYLKHVQDQGPMFRDKALWYSVGAYLLSLLSHPIGIGFFLVLIIGDMFPLRRLRAPTAWLRSRPDQLVLLEKVPFVMIGLLVAMTTIGLQVFYPDYSDPPSPSLEMFGLLARTMQGLYVWTYYVWRVWVPVGLCPTYTTLVQFDPLSLLFVASGVAFLGLTIAAILLRRRLPGLLAAWSAHLIMLVPVLGLTQMNHVANDRYSLLPGMLWSLLFVGLMCRPYGAKIFRALAGGTVVVILVLAVASWKQARVWHDTETLFQYVLLQMEDDPGREDIYFRLANFYSKQGAMKRAEKAVMESIKIRPDHAESRMLYATLLYFSGRYDACLSEIQWAVDEDLLTHDALVLRGMVHMARQEWDSGEEVFQEVLEEDPDFIAAKKQLKKLRLLRDKAKSQ